MNKEEMKGRGAFNPSKQVLVFNAARTLIAVVRSVRSASELAGVNAVAISMACTGERPVAGNHYYRHVHPNVEIEMEDLDNLDLESYDQMCKSKKRVYFSTREMARRKRASEEPKKLKDESDD